MSGRICRVVVRSDQALVAETIRVALAARGLGVVDPDDPSPQARADVGLLVTALTSLRAVGEAQRIISGSDVPWAVVATTPRGPGWAAAGAAGACCIVDSSVSLERIAGTLVDLGRGAEARTVDIPAAIVEQWRHLAGRLRGVPHRDLDRWCRAEPSLEDHPVDGAEAFDELREIEAML